jgi:eukaryotic-like serine/threonine-protein kinase
VNEPKHNLRTSGVAPREPSATISPGTVLAGKYLVGRIIGAGAVGVVLEAKNIELDERVAIKCLRPEMLVDPAMVARFAREAKAAAAIKSEYVATVHDVGTAENGVPYMVMEYLEGIDLGTLVAEKGALPARVAVEYALQVCEALAIAHAKGIVHRDIKPENLLLAERAGGMPIVKVLDFGISKNALTGSIFKHELPLVKTVNLMGTPLYMSPEQVRASDSVDVRSDVWSLGMVLYEILTGHTAFVASSITEICAAILEAQPNPIEMHRSDLPAGLVEVIGKCLQKDATRRYQNVAELALALMPFGPKRTRLNVERAVAVLRSSGHAAEHLKVSSTVPPSFSEASLTPIPRAPSMPSNEPANVSGAPVSAVPASAAPRADSRKRTVAMAIAVVVLAMAGVIALAGGRKDAGEKPAAAATETNAPPTIATPEPPAEAPPPAAQAPPAPAASLSVTPTAPSWGARPGASAKPKAHAETRPKATTSAKPAETEPDLGY